ncbi:MAG: hypothetical protein FH753_14460 [Firmicutes bacterium]|nr:hypothetical protein [Bacillota bacterium]
MKTKIGKYLPHEFVIYNKIKKKEKDPIKKEIYSFQDIISFFSYLKPFPIKSSDYYNIMYENFDFYNIYLFLGLSYFSYRASLSKIDKIITSKSDIVKVMNFVSQFYDCKNPVLDTNGLLWFYPKLEIKKFIKNSIMSKNLNSYYINETTITKLILIITGFVKYEFKEGSNFIKELNMPTLILANIGLYEKGYLKLIEEENDKVGICLNSKGNGNRQKIFTKERTKLKEKIIKVLDNYEKIKCSIDDFKE